MCGVCIPHEGDCMQSVVEAKDVGHQGDHRHGHSHGHVAPCATGRGVDGDGGDPWDITVSVDKDEEKGRGAIRRAMWKMQDRLFAILPLEAMRERVCHRASLPDHGDIVVDDKNRARYRGLIRCGNPWVCPLCAPVIAAKRASEIGSVLKWADAEGFVFFKATFTARHKKSDRLIELVSKQSKALKAFKNGRLARKIRGEMGYVDSITAKEATWGPLAGWHPHQHEYWMCNEKQGFDIEKVKKELEKEWIRVMRKCGLDGAEGVALHISKMKKDEIKQGVASGYLSKAGSAAGYMAKAGSAAAIEIAGGVYKKAKRPHKQDHYTQMELLACGEKWAKSLFREFYEVFRAKKQIVFGRKIVKAYKDLYGTEPDENWQIVKKEDELKKTERVVIRLLPGQMLALRVLKKAVYVLELVEAGEVEKAQEFIDEVYEQSVDASYRASVDRLKRRGFFS